MFGRLLHWLRRQPDQGDPALPRNAYCSFCRRSHMDVGPFAEGPGSVFICGGCAALCGALIAEENSRRSGSPMPAEQPVAALLGRVATLDEGEVARLREGLTGKRAGPAA